MSSVAAGKEQRNQIRQQNGSDDGSKAKLQLAHAPCTHKANFSVQADKLSESPSWEASEAMGVRSKQGQNGTTAVNGTGSNTVL